MLWLCFILYKSLFALSPLSIFYFFFKKNVNMVNADKKRISRLYYPHVNLLSASPTKWSNTLKQFVGFCRRIVWMCFTMLSGLALKGLTSFMFLKYSWALSSISSRQPLKLSQTGLRVDSFHSNWTKPYRARFQLKKSPDKNGSIFCSNNAYVKIIFLLHLLYSHAS